MNQAYVEPALPKNPRLPTQDGEAPNIIETVDEARTGELYVALEHVEGWTGRLRAVPHTFDGLGKRFRAYDVLFGKLRPYLAKVTRPRQAGVCVGEFFVLRSIVSRLESAFLECLLRSMPIIDVINSSTFGARMPRADWQFVGGLSLVFPPPEEQSAIVRFLNHADRRIQRYMRAMKKLIALLNEQKHAIIHRAVTRGLDPNVRFKPSGVEWLGEVPGHWGVSRVKRLARSGPKTFTDGDWIEIPYITEQGVRLIQTGNVGIGEYREKGFRYVSEDTFYNLGCTGVEAGDVLICRLDGPVGRACLAPEFGARMITSVDNVILKAHDGVDPRYVVHVMSSPGWLSWISSICRAGGGFRYRISRSTLGNITIPLPPTPEQRAIADYLEHELGANAVASNRIRAEIELLHEYRTRLIADVVTGKLDVRKAAARLPDEPENLGALDEGDVMGEEEAEGEGADLDTETVA